MIVTVIEPMSPSPIYVNLLFELHSTFVDLSRFVEIPWGYAQEVTLTASSTSSEEKLYPGN